MQQAAEPQPPVEIVTSTKARDTFWTEVRAWGRGESAKVGALCVWAKARGMTDAPC